MLNIVFGILSIYLVAGFLSAIYFLSGPVERIDENAKGSGWGFRLIIFPGTIIFWPVLWRLFLNKKQDHDQTTA